mgnify:CR=1 FL=1
MDKLGELRKGTEFTRIVSPYLFLARPEDKDGNIYAYAGKERDITDRKKAEEALSEYEMIVSSSTDMQAILDTDFV